MPVVRLRSLLLNLPDKILGLLNAEEQRKAFGRRNIYHRGRGGQEYEVLFIVSRRISKGNGAFPAGNGGCCSKYGF